MKKSVILFLLIVISIGLFSQLPSRYFTSISTLLGGERSTYKVEKDNNGFMWFCTPDGAERFDGETIKSYSMPTSDNTRCMTKSSKGGIYYCSTSGLCQKYDEISDRFKTVLDLSKSEKVFVRSICIDKDDILYIGTNQGLFFYDLNNEKLHKLNNEVVNIVSVQGNFVYVSLVSKVLIIKPENDKIHAFRNAEEILLSKSEKIYSFYYDTDTKNLLLGTFDNGVILINKQQQKRLNLLNLKNSPVRCIKLYNQNTILVAAYGKGIYELDRYTLQIKAKSEFDIDTQGALGSNGVYDLFIDTDRRIWASTYTDGINLYDPNSMNFRYLTHRYKDLNSIGNNHVKGIYETSNNSIWFGTNDGISMFDSFTGQWKHFLDKDPKWENNRMITSICQDKDGTIWAGGYGSGLISIHPTTNAVNVIRANESENGLTTNFIYSIFNDSKGRLWIGGNEGDLCFKYPNSTTFKKYPLSSVYSILEEDEYHLLTISNRKLASLNIATGKISYKIDSIVTKAKLLSDDPISCFKKDRDILWIGTKNSGLIKYNYLNQTCKAYGKELGLAARNIFSIEIDNNKRLWVATEKGLFFIDPFNDNIIPFQTGWRSERGTFNLSASKLCSSGQIIFGTTRGALIFDPNKVFAKSISSPLVFEDFKIFDKSIFTFNDENPLEKPLNIVDKIKLKYHQNTFSIEFRRINFNGYERSLYSWYLEGFDKDWTTPTDIGKANYANLSPGKYVFKVREIRNKSSKNVTDKSIVIIISAPWWNSIWAWFIYIIVSAILGYFIFRYFKERIETHYSEEKIQFFINASHGMRTSLTLIKAPLADLQQDVTLSPSAKYLLQVVNNNVNRLYGVINRLLDFEKSNIQTLQLYVHEYTLNDYLNEKVFNFQPYANSSKVTLKTELPDQNISVWFDKDLMDKILENLISNAIKYSLSNGSVTVLAGYDSTKWWIEVQDKGIGIPQKEQQKLFKKFYRAENAVNSQQVGSGIGLMLVYNLTHYLGGTVSFDSKEGEHTHFRVAFPEGNEHYSKNQLSDTHFENLNTAVKETGELILEEQSVILIVDDNDELRKYLSVSFSQEFSVLTAASATEAINILKNNTVNIVLSDIMMPEVSGIELCQSIKSNRQLAHIPVVLLSALSSKDDILKGLQIGADDYITKPFDPAHLKQRIVNILSNKRKLIEYFRESNFDDKTKNQDFFNEIDRILLEKTEKIINENIANDKFSIDFLCRELGMSRSVFYNRIKNLINLSPNELIRNKRMKYAGELLKSRLHTVTEVSEMVGFVDPKYFSTVFSKYFGCSPSNFNKK